MYVRSIALALLISTAANMAVGATIPNPAPANGTDAVSKAGHRRPADCHRSVRTHWINGVLLRHRHVGKDCAVREVKRLKAK